MTPGEDQKKNQPIENKITDLLVKDKTVLINASLCNGLAHEICAIW